MPSRNGSLHFSSRFLRRDQGGFREYRQEMFWFLWGGLNELIIVLGHE